MVRSSLLLGLLAVAASVDATARNVTVAATDTSQITYTGSGWRDYTGCTGTRFTYGVGDVVTFSFTGTAIFIYGTISRAGGVFNVNTDGEDLSVNRYSNVSYTCNQLLYWWTGIPNTLHQVKITFSGNSSNVVDDQGYLDWQNFVYTMDDSNQISTSTALTPTTGQSLPSTASTAGTQSGQSTGTSTPAPAAKSNAGPIAGGVVGGILGLGLIGGIVFFLMRRKQASKTAAPPPPVEMGQPPSTQPLMGYSTGGGAPYGGTPGPFGGTPAPYSGTPGPFVGPGGQYDPSGNQFNNQGNQFNPQPNQFGAPGNQFNAPPPGQPGGMPPAGMSFAAEPMEEYNSGFANPQPGYSIPATPYSVGSEAPLLAGGAGAAAWAAQQGQQRQSEYMGQPQFQPPFQQAQGTGLSQNSNPPFGDNARPNSFAPTNITYSQPMGHTAIAPQAPYAPSPSLPPIPMADSSPPPTSYSGNAQSEAPRPYVSNPGPAPASPAPGQVPAYTGGGMAIPASKEGATYSTPPTRYDDAGAGGSGAGRAPGYDAPPPNY